MKKLAIALLLCLALNGCIPVAFVVGAGAAGAVLYDKRNLKQIVHDKHIAHAAQSSIEADPELRTRTHILVSGYNRVLLLVGEAETPELRQRALQRVMLVPGVKRIYNEVTITNPVTTHQQNHDAWITTKVKTEMLVRRGLHSSQIKIVTEKNVVYLMGKVSHQQAALATDVARRVSGVRQVVQVFEYTDKKPKAKSKAKQKSASTSNPGKYRL
ncbi:MAG: BON domain-containing protein [Gammaproteobacteria bacterium]|nr:BON domain-containing protein [Gammaproteobacteria bacterium]